MSKSFRGNEAGPSLQTWKAFTSADRNMVTMFMFDPHSGQLFGCLLRPHRFFCS